MRWWSFTILAGLLFPTSSFHFHEPAPRPLIAIVGTPHLAALRPLPSSAQTEAVVEALARWNPTRICIEAMPGERVSEFQRYPQRYGELLQTFAHRAVTLAAEQRNRLRLDVVGATDSARHLSHQMGPLSPSQRVQLTALYLAANEPWSAALVWSSLSREDRDAGVGQLGRLAVASLEEFTRSRNEIARIAIPLALRLGHRDFCHVDPFLDEVGAAALADELRPALADPTLESKIEAYSAYTTAQWEHGRADGLLRLYAWMQSADFERRDREAQWDVLQTLPSPNDAGVRRLTLWNARNLEIAANLMRAIEGPRTSRTLLLIGSAHRPFLERIVHALPWLESSPASSVITTR